MNTTRVAPAARVAGWGIVFAMLAYLCMLTKGMADKMSEERFQHVQPAYTGRSITSESPDQRFQFSITTQEQVGWTTDEWLAHHDEALEAELKKLKAH